MKADQEPIEEPGSEAVRPPNESYLKLFARFLRFGSLAWGGPVAQIDMIRHELVEEERWVTRSHFRKLLAIYQVLPGPEAHELCVHFGMLARGRIGGILAGLGFMLPGFVLMFLLSWLYLSFGLENSVFEAVFRGVQPAVIALIFRACHRIGGHTLTDKGLWAIAGLVGIADFLGITFWISLPFAGLAYLLYAKKRHGMAIALGLVFSVSALFLSPKVQLTKPAESNVRSAEAQVARVKETGKASIDELFLSGLRSGLLTFGGAYTAIPFLERDAVEKGGWMTKEDFLDGIALSGILPAPLIIFSTFVGYFGGGPLGALVITAAIFFPAFAFSLLFYRHLEAVIENPLLRHFLEGVTAGVVGIIASTLIRLAGSTITDLRTLVIFGLALTILYLWKSKTSVPVIVIVSGVVGWLLFR